MIVTRIDGGLGNQLFQYAYGLSLATRWHVPLRLDLNAYADAPPHGYLLDRFQISAQPLRPAEQRLIPRRYRTDRWLSGLGDLLGSGTLPRHKEEPFGFDPRHLSVPANRYLVGYWQSERFFPEMRESLLEEFRLQYPLSSESARVAEEMRTGRSVALHIRRGDYMTGAAASIYCHLELEYYQRALSDWASHYRGVTAFVFSNDLAWCRQHLRIPCPAVFVDHNTPATAHEDLELLRHAECCVIANSTFSWWGAWLNERPDKTVYAPETWFRAGTHDGSHIIPAGWRKVPLVAPGQTRVA